jgi:hypothetical protein
MLFQDIRGPEDGSLPLYEPYPELLPIEFDDSRDLDRDSFWTNMNQIGESCRVDNDDEEGLNDSIMSIPEFIDDSLESEDVW